VNRRHLARCIDDDGHIECVCDQPEPHDADAYAYTYDPDDYQPMGGDPYWADLER
jgi:hypothetical protein